MGSLKLQSFEDFSTAASKKAAIKLEEDKMAARNKAADQFKALLSEFDVTSVKDLKEDDRNTFYKKLSTSEISESVAIIEEGTRSQIGIINKRGKIESVYMHYDGYPDHMLPTIKKGYMNSGAVKGLLKKGGGSFLEVDPSKINFYGDKVTMKGDAKDVAKYIKNAEYDGGAEFVYLYDERDGKWYMADTYDEPRELKPAFESSSNIRNRGLFINEKFVISKGNVRDAKKVSQLLTFRIGDSVLSNENDVHLGSIKYLLMYALEDANFHRYMEPVAKKVGGRIKAVTIETDQLEGIELPVGPKTIKKYLDMQVSDVAKAAGWSGIGIVEGVADHLNDWGFSKQAQAIVDEFNLIWANESAVTEGNAFLAARAKAIEEDAEEFEFNGKIFPVIEAAAVKILKDKWPYVEFKADGKKHKVDFEYEDDIDDHGNEGKDQFYRGEDQEGTVWYVDVYSDYRGEVQDVHWNTLEREYGPGESKVIGESLKSDIKTYQRQKKLGYNDQFHGDKSLSYTLSSDLGMNPKHEFGGGDWLGFDHVDLYVNGGKKEGTVLDGALTGKYTYDDLKSAAAKFLGIKESKEIISEGDVAKVSKKEIQFHLDQFEKGNIEGEDLAQAIEEILYGKLKEGDKAEDLGEEMMQEAANPVNEVEEYKAGDTVKLKTGETVKINQVVKGPRPQFNTYRAKIKGKLVDFGLTDINEAEVKSDEDFKEYAFAVLQKAFGDKFDEEKAQEVVDGLLSKHSGDYGAAVGALQSSLG